MTTDLNSMRRLLLALAGLALAAPPAAHPDTVRYYHLDGLGSVRAVTNQAGAVVERHDYLPYGEECTTGPCASNPGVGAGQPRKFTGKERDTETGLDYFGARYYGSKIGRFTTVDPAYTIAENLADPQRWNRYAYARNNPLRYQDPDGRIIVPVAIVLGGLFLLNNVANTNVTEGPVNATIVPNSVLVAGGYGLTVGGARLAAKEVFEEVAGLPTDLGDLFDVGISRARSPLAARHREDAQAAGRPCILTLDRSRARPNRQQSLKGTQPQKGLDRDEYPPACCAEGGAGASVRPIPPGDNRSAGGQLGQQVKRLPDGTRIRVKTTE